MNKLHTPNSQKVDFNYTVRELVLLHKRGVLTDSEFSVLVRAIGTSHIENEIDKKFHDLLKPIKKLMYAG